MDRLADFFNIEPELLFDILNFTGKFLAFQIAFFVLVLFPNSLPKTRVIVNNN